MEDGTQEWGSDSCVTPTALESRRTLERVGDSWSLLVIHTLRHGPTRFAQLQRQIDGISQRMLSRTLRSLERDGLVTRTVYPTNPPSVEYALTPSGVSLKEAVRPLIAWTVSHHDQIDAARARYDEATAAEPALSRP